MTSSITPPAADFDCDLLVLGAGPGGYSAAFRAADLGLKTLLIEHSATLGGVCLNVGCIPSKSLLHVTLAAEEAQSLAKAGICFNTPTVDLDQLRSHKSSVVGKLTGGLAAMAKARKVEVVRGEGKFSGPHTMDVVDTQGQRRTFRFAKAVIAAGSRPVALPFLPQDPRIIDSTGALELASIPRRMLVIGGGIIGMEMATVYSGLGTRITVAELGPHLIPGADRDLVKVWEKFNTHRFDHVRTATAVTAASATDEGIVVTYQSGGSECFDMVLVAVGRTPNGKLIGAENAGVEVDDRGFIRVDQRQRTNVEHIFAVGDIVGQPMLAHKAVHEAHVAAEAAAGLDSAFSPRQIPSVAYTNPEIAWAGKTEEQCKTEGLRISKATFPWAASGRALANGREEGATKLLFDETSRRLIGGGIVGVHAGDLIGEVCLAIEAELTAHEIGHTIHPHPTLCESVGLAAEVLEGTCTDLPPLRKRL